MNHFSKIGYVLVILTFMCSCTSKVVPSQSSEIAYENPDLISNGYSKESPRYKTSSSSTVDAQNAILGLDVYLRGLAGVTVTGDGANASVVVHGIGSFSSSNEPLFVIDNVAISGGYASAYQTINAAEIKRVSVLKDAASAGIYGSRGGNGVIIITRKKGNQ
jgi:TonB-dependent SusC/RagA subfamily outer membrane receptor